MASSQRFAGRAIRCAGRSVLCLGPNGLAGRVRRIGGRASRGATEDTREVVLDLSRSMREALLAAIGENIIRGAFRDRAGAIAAALHRSAQHAFTLRLRLQAAASADPLPGYAVGTIDADRNNADLGADVTDSQGE